MGECRSNFVQSRRKLAEGTGNKVDSSPIGVSFATFAEIDGPFPAGGFAANEEDRLLVATSPEKDEAGVKRERFAI